MNTTWNIRFDEAGLHFRYKVISRSLHRVVVLFPALRSQTSVAVEYYNRLTWADLIDADCIYVADPGLRPKSPVRGSWFQGNRRLFAAEATSRHLRMILNRFDLLERNCVLYGSSQGGFAAMAVGAFMPAATVLAECPQTDVSLYDQVEDVDRAAIECYGLDKMEMALPTYAVRIRLADLYKSRRYVPRSTVLVKRSDAHHLEVHIKPLVKTLGGDRISVELFDDFGSSGHTPLPNELVIDRLNTLELPSNARISPASGASDVSPLPPCTGL